MPTHLKSKLLLPAAVLAALLAVPATAGATLSYVKNPFNATVFVANDDGSVRTRLRPGTTRTSLPMASRSPTCTKGRRARRN
jgi:hypothetical protein